MLGRTHQVIGLTAGLATYLVAFPAGYGPASFAASLLAAHFGALLPDIDQPTSTIWLSLPAGRVAGEITNPFLQHRNLTHSLLGFVLVGLLLNKMLLYLPPYWGIHLHRVLLLALVAYASHLMADAVTVEGIPLLFPYQHMFGLPPRPLEGLRIETGHWFENLIIFPAVNLILIGLVWTRWPIIHHLLFQ